MNDGPHHRMSSTTTKEHTCGEAAEAQVEVPAHSALDAHARAGVALAVVAVVQCPASPMALHCNGCWRTVYMFQRTRQRVSPHRFAPSPRGSRLSCATRRCFSLQRHAVR
jgi:hypothetical protein